MLRLEMKIYEDHGKQFVKSNELIKKDFDMERDSIPHEEEEKYLMNLLENGLLNFII